MIMILGTNSTRHPLGRVQRLVERLLVSTWTIKGLVETVRSRGLPERQEENGGLLKPWVYVSDAPPPVVWDRQSIESTLGVRLPHEVVEMWMTTAGLTLYVEENHRQWGLIVWSPEEVVDPNRKFKELYKRDLRDGDLIMGEFLGDSDLLLLRCDDRRSDYGKVLIVDPYERRKSWKVPAASFGLFLQRFCEAKGDKYWEYGWQERDV
jgi:hypothetical protein